MKAGMRSDNVLMQPRDFSAATRFTFRQLQNLFTESDMQYERKNMSDRSRKRRSVSHDGQA